MAEVHIIGEIDKAQGFEDHSLFARWTIIKGSAWRALEGFTEGQTQLAVKSRVEDADESTNHHSWSHPLDVHYVTKGIQGWPRIELQIWGVDWMGKCNISAYGFLSVPARTGYHELKCHTWRPVGDFRHRIVDFVTGHRVHLVDPSDVVSNGLNRHMIRSVSMGVVQVNLTVVLKDFQEYGIDFD